MKKIILLIFFGIFLLPQLVVSLSCGDYLNANTTMTANLNCSGNDGLVLNKSHLVLNCDNYNLTGNNSASSVGINFTGVDNIQIRNCNVYDFLIGIRGDTSNNALIEDSLVNNSGAGAGIQFSVFVYGFNVTNVEVYTNTAIAYDLVVSGGKTDKLTAYSNTNYAYEIVLVADGSNLSNSRIHSGSNQGIRNVAAQRSIYINNTITSTSSNALYMGTYFTDPDYNEFYNNTFNSTTGLTVLIVNGDNNYFYNNQVYQKGANNNFQTSNSKNNVYTNNTFICTVLASNKDAFRMINNDDYNEFYNNTFVGQLNGMYVANTINDGTSENNLYISLNRGMNSAGDYNRYSNDRFRGGLVQGLITSAANRNNFTECRFNNTDGTDEGARLVSNSNDNIFLFSNFSGEDGIGFNNAHRNIVNISYMNNVTNGFVNDNLATYNNCTTCIINATTNDIVVKGGSTDIWFINSTFEQWGVDLNINKFYIADFVRANVTNGVRAIPNANVSAKDKFSTKCFDDTTGTDGLSDWHICKQSYYQPAGWTYYDNYTLTANHSGIVNSSKAWNTTIEDTHHILLALNSCYYFSGDHTFYCEDYCDLGNINIMQDNITITGNGTFRGNLTNFTSIKLENEGWCEAWIRYW